MDNTDLQKFIEAAGIDAEILPMKGRVHSVEAASKELGVPPEQFIKTVVFVGAESAILAIVLGVDRVSSKRIGKALGITPPKLASPEEALALTKYAVGGTPPISIKDVRVLMDDKVVQANQVIGGGGSDYHLLRILPLEIINSANAEVFRIRK